MTIEFLGQLQSDFPHLDIEAGHNRTQTTQALIQLGVLVMTLFTSLIGGALTGNDEIIQHYICRYIYCYRLPRYVVHTHIPRGRKFFPHKKVEYLSFQGVKL